jgi:serine O-acetyltransferase
MTQSTVHTQARSLRYESGKPLAMGLSNENPKDIGLLALLAEDFRVHGSTLLAPGFWALAWHRLGNARMDVESPLARAPLSVIYRIGYHAIIAAFNIDLPYNAKIGRRFRIRHHGNVRLGARVVGDDVCIRHTATIGLASRAERSASPVIGNRVEIGMGACIVGDIEIGDDAFIGPNSVVADDVPAGGAVLGVPARLVTLADLVEPACAPELDLR